MYFFSNLFIVFNFDLDKVILIFIFNFIGFIFLELLFFDRFVGILLMIFVFCIVYKIDLCFKFIVFVEML